MTANVSNLRWLVALAAVAFSCVGTLPAAEQAGRSPSESEMSGFPWRVAALPLTNRSGRAAPLREIRASLMLKLRNRGVKFVSEEQLTEFMRRHRMRYAAGLGRNMAQMLAAETGAGAVLIASLDLYDDRVPPKMGLTARLVSTGAQPAVLWMDSSIRVGDDSPKAFDVGLIADLTIVSEIVISGLVDSLPHPSVVTEINRERATDPSEKTRWRFRPDKHYASPDLPIVRDEPARIVVLPFANDTTTRHAGEIMTDQLVRHLVEVGADVIEPGVVREVMLETRQFYNEGPSFPQTDLLRLHLRADVVVFGEISRFSEKLGANAVQVEFLVRAVDAGSGELIWASSSSAGGNKGVFFFGVGQVHAAQGLASEMARAMVAMVIRERARAAKRR